MRLVRTQGSGGKQTRQMLAELELRGARNTARTMPVVQRIVADVRKGGDLVLRRYAAKLDGLTPQQPLEISRAEMEQAWKATPKALQAAMETAAANIRRFAGRQMPKDWSAATNGLTTGQRVRALGAVGCYVPSGRYPLPSTLLMTVIPAQVAGVQRIVAVSAKPAKETLAAAALLGVRRVLPHRWRAGDCGTRFRDRVHPTSGQDRRTGKLVCDCGQENGGVRLRDRHAGRPDGDRGDERKRRSGRDRFRPGRPG